MKLTQINDPAVRNRTKEMVGQVEAANAKQAEALLRDLASRDDDGICFGRIEDSRIECIRCTLEPPCRRFRELWGKVIKKIDADAKK